MTKTKRDVPVMVLTTKTEKAWMVAEAIQAGLTLSSWIRATCLARIQSKGARSEHRDTMANA